MRAADLARCVHDLVREPRTRKRFQEQTEEHLIHRIRGGAIWNPMQVLNGKWECELIDSDAPTQITLDGKYAVLTALHDLEYESDGPILPAPDCRGKKSLSWYIFLDFVRDHAQKHLQRIEDWYKDVVAALMGTAAKDRERTTTPAEPQANGAGAPAGGDEGEAEPLTGANRSRVFQSLQDCHQKAYLAFQYAETKNGKRLEDREAFDWLKENGIDTAKGDVGTLAGYSLPAFDTWARYLRTAREALDEQKYKRRGRPPLTRSIVASNQIENQKGDD